MVGQANLEVGTSRHRLEGVISCEIRMIDHVRVSLSCSLNNRRQNSRMFLGFLVWRFAHLLVQVLLCCSKLLLNTQVTTVRVVILQTGNASTEHNRHLSGTLRWLKAYW